MICVVHIMNKELEDLFYKVARSYLQILKANINKLRNPGSIKNNTAKNKIINKIALVSHNLEGDSLLAKKYKIAHAAAKINYLCTNSLINNVDTLLLSSELHDYYNFIKPLIKLKPKVTKK
jgi:hypothetical protein